MSSAVERDVVLVGQLHHHVDDFVVGGARIEEQPLVHRVLELVVVERRPAGVEAGRHERRAR